MRFLNLNLKFILSDQDGDMLLVSFCLFVLGFIFYMVIKRWQTAPYRNDIRFQQSLKISDDLNAG